MANLDRTRLGITAALALAAACSAQGTGGQSGQGGAASSAQGSGHGSTAASSSSLSAVASVTSGAGGSTPFVCNPPAAPGSIFEATAESYGMLDPVSMCKYRGDVLLVVNVAAL